MFLIRGDSFQIYRIYSTLSVADKKAGSKTGGSDGTDGGDNKTKMNSLVKKMAGSFLQKSFSWKEKVTKFIENTDDEWLQAADAGSSSKNR